MENRILKYFLVVAQEENITRAAEILHVSQPALSKQLMQLEEELGTKLFIRGKRSLTLTEEGRFLKERAQEIVDLTEKTERDFKNGIGTFNGVISIGMGESSASEWLTTKIVEFLAIYPDVRFDFYSATADTVKIKMEKGLLDMGILTGPTGELSKYNHITLPTTDNWGILVSPSNELSKKQFVTATDLRNEKLFISKRSLNQTEIAKWFGEDYSEKNVIGTYNLLKNAAMLVKKNLGVALAIDGATTIYDKQSVVWIPFKPEIKLKSVLVWKKYKDTLPSATKFIEFINHSIKL